MEYTLIQDFARKIPRPMPPTGRPPAQAAPSQAVHRNLATSPVNQLDIKTLIKDCFGLAILWSSKFLKPFLNMISERLFITSVQYFGNPHTCTCVM